MFFICLINKVFIKKLIMKCSFKTIYYYSYFIIMILNKSNEFSNDVYLCAIEFDMC